MQARTRRINSTSDLRDLDSEWDPVPRPGIPLLLVDDHPEPVVCFWMMALTKTHSPDSIKTYAYAIEHWWGLILLQKIRWWEVTVHDFEKWMGKFRRDGLSTSTLHTMGAAVCSFYKWANTHAYIDRVPFRISDGRWRCKERKSTSADPPEVKLGTVRQKKPGIVTAEQFDQILANIKHRNPGLLRRDELMAMCGKWMGLRRQEVVGLKVNQLRDMVDARLGPNDSMPFLALELDPNTTKGAKGGVVLVIPMLVKKFRDYIAPGGYRDQIVGKARQRAVAAGKKYVEPDEVFLTVHGTPIKRETLSSYFKQAARAAKVDSRFHKLRHTAATNVAAVTFAQGSKGYLVVQNLLRHSDQKTTQIYVDHALTQSAMYQSLMSLNDMAMKEEQEKGC